MAGSLKTTGTVTLRNVASDGNAEVVDTTAVVTLKRKIKDTNLTVKVSNATLQNYKQLSGALLSICKPLGKLVVATATYDVGAKSTRLQLQKIIKRPRGQLLDLGALWIEKTGHCILEMTAKPCASQKLFATLNANTRALQAAYTMKLRGVDITPAHNWTKDVSTLSVAAKLPDKRHTVKASYAYPNKDIAAEWTCKPFKVGVSSRILDNGLARPTIGLMVEREFVIPVPRPHSRPVDTAAKPASGEASRGAQAASPRASPTTDPSLSSKLRQIDESFERMFAAHGKKGGPGDLEVVSYKRKV